MSEYRVKALYYRFQSEVDHDRFDSAAPQGGVLGTWTYTLEEGALKAVPSVEFRDRQAAMDDLESHLRAWEQAAFLTRFAYRIRFDYDHSDIEEVDPQPGSVTVFPETIRMLATVGGVTIIRGNPAYPEPDPTFLRTALTDRLTERLRRVRDREAELPAAAYVVLDTLEAEFGGGSGKKRTAVANALSVDEAVLSRLGAVSSRADPSIGRKGGGDSTPLTGAERVWIEATVLRLIRRVGEHAAGATLTPISMADLPPVP